MTLGVPFRVDFPIFLKNGESMKQDARAPELSHKQFKVLLSLVSQASTRNFREADLGALWRRKRSKEKKGMDSGIAIC